MANKVGRKSNYYTLVEPNLKIIEYWCRDGAIDEEIWNRLGISKTSFYKYQNEHEEFANALKKEKELVDYSVEDSLLMSARGHVKELRKPFKLKEVYYDDKGKRCENERVAYGIEEVYYPPVPLSIIYWLKNRMKGKWRDKPVFSDEEKETIEKLDKILESLDNQAGDE